MQTCMVFAARYTHHRGTGGTLAVVKALKGCWHQLPEYTQTQILIESEDATENLEDWQMLKDFAAEYRKGNP